MRSIIIVLILFFSIHFSIIVVGSSIENVAILAAGQDLTTTDQEDDPLSIEQDFYLNQLQQKELESMNKKEQVIWSFRMAPSRPFQ